MKTHVAPSFRLSFAFLAIASWLGACADGGPGVPYDPEDPEQQMDIRLELLEPTPDDPTLVLGYGETGRIRVRVVLSDGTPVEGAPVRFEIPPSADPRGSMLAASADSSDPDGIAEVTVQAGMEAATFAVQPTFREERLSVTVAVSDVEAGRIKATMRYGGTQPLEKFSGQLFKGVTCDSLTPGALPGAEQTAPPVGSLSATIRFINLEPATDYSVLVTAYVEDDVFAAYGCVDNVAVMARSETPVDVELRDIDLPARFEGVYDLFNEFNFSGALPGNAGAAIEIIHELGDDDALMGAPERDKWGQDPGAFVVDLAMRQTCAWRCLGGEDYDSCSSLDHGYGDLRLLYTQDFQRWDGAQSRFWGGCGAWDVAISGRKTTAMVAQEWINQQIGEYLPESFLRFSQTASDLAGAITNANIMSVLTLSSGHTRSSVPFRHELTRMEVSVRDLSGMRREINFSLRDAGISSVLAMGTATAEGNRLAIPTHEFRLHFGRLLSFLWKEILRLYGYDSTAALLASWIDCDAIAAELAARENIIDLSEDQYRRACNSGIAAAGRFVENKLADVGGETSIYLRGTVIGTDITTDDLVQRLTMGQWEGMWGEEGASDEIRGTFRGQLRGTAPTMGGM